MENEIEAFLVKYSADRHLALYLKTRDGLLIWQAYSEYRKHGMQVPEDILLKLDEYASALSRAVTPNEVAAAVEMKTKKGGIAGKTRTRAAERRRDIIEHVHVAISVGIRPTVAYFEAAKRFGTTSGRVKTLYNDWRNDSSDNSGGHSLWNCW